MLTSALELIGGEIGADELARWPWASRTIHKLQADIVDASVTLGRLALEHDEPALAEWAATQTRLGVPFDQQAVTVAVDAKTALGDRVGIRRLHDELIDLHDGDLEPDVQAAFTHALAG